MTCDAVPHVRVCTIDADVVFNTSVESMRCVLESPALLVRLKRMCKPAASLDCRQSATDPPHWFARTMIVCLRQSGVCSHLSIRIPPRPAIDLPSFAPMHLASGNTGKATGRLREKAELARERVDLDRKIAALENLSMVTGPGCTGGEVRPPGSSPVCSWVHRYVGKASKSYGGIGPGKESSMRRRKMFQNTPCKWVIVFVRLGSLLRFGPLNPPDVGGGCRCYCQR